MPADVADARTLCEVDEIAAGVLVMLAAYRLRNSRAD
jgi:hypothetical protein